MSLNSFRLMEMRALLACAVASAVPLAQAQTQTLPPMTVSVPRADLTVPSTQDALVQIRQTPGGVELVPDTAWKERAASTIKDIVDFTPGVFAQSKFGGDARLSIRGSGLSRYFHLRGIDLLQDGVPLNDADGSSGFEVIDPTAYRYTEIYKGANALRYGSGTLGGAINFVSPTGYDASRFQGRVDLGSHDWGRAQLSTGFVQGAADGFLTGSWQHDNGFREHSSNHGLRLNGNLGWRLSDSAETRFFVSGGGVRSELPGSVSRDAALSEPRRAAPGNVTNDWQRGLDFLRLSNRTVLVSGSTIYEAGGWLSRTHLDHPIYQYIDNWSSNQGLYARMQRVASVAGHANRTTLGFTLSGGQINAHNYDNVGGNKGGLLSHTDDDAGNLNLYAENAFDVVPDVSLVTGVQYLRAQRKRRDLFNGGASADRNGDKEYTLVNPKLGVLWQAGPTWQVYGNLSRSGEPPTFADMQFSDGDDLARLKPQRATTLEIGTRGSVTDLEWDMSIYRARLHDELQCVSSPFNICNTTVNIDRSIHQGVELGLRWTAARGLFERGANAADSLTLAAAYTYSDFHFSNDPAWGNNRIPGAPRHYVHGELMYRHPSGFYAGPTLEWVPQAYYVDNANTLKTRAYALLGLRAGWKSGRYALFVEGRNLTNRKYIASASVTDIATPTSALFEPGAGRALFVGLQVEL